MTEVDRTGRTVVGLFHDRRHAEEAIRDLQTSGFHDDQIGLAMQDSNAESTEEANSAAAEGAVKGVVGGGVIGGVIGLLGSLLVPGLGAVVVGGVLASAIAAAGVGAATGGVIGTLMAVGVPEDAARHFDLGLQSGGALVTVDAESRTGEALAIMQRHEVDLGPAGEAGYRLGHHQRLDSSAPIAMTERRRVADPAYAGPERRLIAV